VLPAAARHGLWLPLHLALVGAGSTAIVAVMPFFVAAFAAAPPADARLRSGALASVAAGAVVISAGVSMGLGPVAAVGGAVYLGGIGAAAVATVRPTSRSLGPSRGLVTRAYLLALLHVAIGALLASLLLAGWPPVVEAWGAARPAHAWLNLVGFVSLVIATTLLHFFPTVTGTKIVARPSAIVAVAGLAGAAELVAAGSLLGIDVLARAGALLGLAGAGGLAAYAWATASTRGTWTTDLPWHRFAIGGLSMAIAWFGLGMVVAAGRVLQLGSSPDAWSTPLVAGPLVVGWLGLAVLASATHLLPAVGPGSPSAHARQRRVLGSAALVRLAALNLGCLVLTLGLALGVDAMVGAGAGIVAAGTLWTGGLLLRAVAIGLREPTSR
jgi:hypothetical protein